MGYDAYQIKDFKTYVHVTLFSGRSGRRAFLDGWRAAEARFIAGKVSE